MRAPGNRSSKPVESTGLMPTQEGVVRVVAASRSKIRVPTGRGVLAYGLMVSGLQIAALDIGGGDAA